jgi:fructoselysine 6-kinase
MVRLLGIGDNTVDIYLTEGMQYPGGNAVNVAVQARRCGAWASYLGCLGRDRLGDLVHGSLVAEGVDVSHVRRIDGPNPWSRIRHDGPDRIFAGSNPGVRGCYDLGPGDDRFIAAHDVVHTSVHSGLDAQMPRLKASARLLSYDYSEHWERPGVAATMRHVDIAFLSGPRRGMAECEELLRWCAGQGPSVVVVTRGTDGACALHVGQVHTQPVHPAEVVDTLGAGDGFIAGFLVAHAGGLPLPACLARGAAQAAAVCAIKGGFGHGTPIVPGQPGLDPSQVVPRGDAARHAPITQQSQRGADR